MTAKRVAIYCRALAMDEAEALTRILMKFASDAGDTVIECIAEARKAKDRAPLLGKLVKEVRKAGYEILRVFNYNDLARQDEETTLRMVVQPLLNSGVTIETWLHDIHPPRKQLTSQEIAQKAHTIDIHEHEKLLVRLQQATDLLQKLKENDEDGDAHCGPMEVVMRALMRAACSKDAEEWLKPRVR